MVAAVAADRTEPAAAAEKEAGQIRLAAVAVTVDTGGRAGEAECIESAAAVVGAVDHPARAEAAATAVAAAAAAAPTAVDPTPTAAAAAAAAVGPTVAAAARM